MSEILDAVIPSIVDPLFDLLQTTTTEIGAFGAGVETNPANFDVTPNFLPLLGFAGEVVAEGIGGAVVNANIRLLYQSIKVGGAYCRGEQELGHEELVKILTLAVEGLQGGFVRGVTIKVIQKLTGSNLLAAIGFTLSTEGLPTLLRVMQNELTVEQAIAEIGPKVFTSGVITTIVLMFPQAGTLMLGTSLIEAIWAEISPEWKENLQQNFNAAISSPGYRPASS